MLAMSDAHDFDELDYITPPPALKRILARTAALGFDMSSEPRTGALLCALAASKPGGRLLELGTGTGVATAWLLCGMDAHSKLISVDTNPEVQAVAREFLGEDQRLTLVLEDGLQFLQRQMPESYEFVFADAMRGKYDGLEACLRVIKPGGLYVIDDLLPQANWPTGRAEKVPVLVNQLANDERFAILPLAWASGIIVAAKRT
jgi:predicted O-methyltransferase YrrM